ncbi:MAG: hypothetical protein Q9203_007775, partial [Teloschistes exilis]
YHDHDPILPLFLEAQTYYTAHSIPTKVKSCAFTTVDEALAQAGVDAMTLPGETHEELFATPTAPSEQHPVGDETMPEQVPGEMTPQQALRALEARSAFLNPAVGEEAKAVESGFVAQVEGGPVKQAEVEKRRSYIDDERGFLRDFCADGRGRAKTEDIQAEALVAASMMN